MIQGLIEEMAGYLAFLGYDLLWGDMQYTFDEISSKDRKHGLDHPYWRFSCGVGTAHTSVTSRKRERRIYTSCQRWRLEDARAVVLR